MFMRPTVCLLIAAALCLSGLRAAAGVDSAPAAEELPLPRALEQALAHHLGLSAARYLPADALDTVLIEQAAFDLELFAATTRSESQAAAASSALDSASVPQSEYRSARGGVQKRLSSGARLTLDSGFGRRSSNNNAARNPDYATDVGLSVRQPLWKGAGKTLNLAPIARARVSAEQSLFELRSAILDVLAQTEIAYWNLAHARAQSALIASALQLAQRLLAENRERESLGLATPLEVLQAETEVVRQQQAVIDAERAIEDASDALREQMGAVSFLGALGPVPALSALPAELSALRPLAEVLRDTLSSDAAAQAQARALEVRRIEAMLAEEGIRPNLDLTAELHYTGRDADGVRAYRDAYTATGYDWNVGLELRVPWGLRAARATARQAQRSVARETLRLYALKQQKAQAARAAWRAVRAGQQGVAVTDRGRELSRQSFEQARARYREGLLAYREVLEAQRDLDRARSQHLSAQIDRLRAEVRLSRVDGTILARHGYSWESLDRLAEPPELEAHPQAAGLLTPEI